MAKQPGRNDLCPCGSGRKYKQCCLRVSAPESFLVKPTDRPDVIDYHLVKRAGSERWERRPGRLAVQILGKKSEDVDDTIEDLFQVATNTAAKSKRRILAERLRDCKHKLYAVKYHLETIQHEISCEVAQFQESYEPHSGATFEIENPVLVYETEAFLFQTKSNLDVMIKVVGLVVPAAKSFRTFSHKGHPSTPQYRAGGTVIDTLRRSKELELADVIEDHRITWIQDMTILRDTITHHSKLEGFRCFLEEPYQGKDRISVHYPVMPSGQRVDLFCQNAYENLHRLYREVLAILLDRMGASES